MEVTEDQQLFGFPHSSKYVYVQQKKETYSGLKLNLSE